MEMALLKAKQSAFLEETCSYYNSTTRNTNDKGYCKYYPAHDKTEGCAIGRKIADKDLCKKLDSISFNGIFRDEIFNKLPYNLKELGKNFLDYIQNLHDKPLNWDENGLSEEGIKIKTLIINKFELNK